MELTVLWDQVLNEIQKKHSKPSFETWIKGTKASSLQDDVLIVTAPNIFARDWLEARYQQLMTDTVYGITGERVELRFTVSEELVEEANEPNMSSRLEAKQAKLSGSSFNGADTFRRLEERIERQEKGAKRSHRNFI
jgi:chromosomal replication initiator protein